MLPLLSPCHMDTPFFFVLLLRAAPCFSMLLMSMMLMAMLLMTTRLITMLLLHAAPC